MRNRINKIHPFYGRERCQKSPQVVKGEKWACSILKAGKDKPIIFVAKTRDFKRFREINKEKSGISRLPVFVLSDNLNLRPLPPQDRLLYSPSANML